MNYPKIENSNLPGPILIDHFSKKSIKKSYEDWYAKIINKYFEKASSRHDDIDEFMEECCFFFTMTFSQSDVFREKQRLGLMNGDFSVELDTFQLLYTTIAQKIFGKTWTRKKFEAKVPQAIVCVDFEGSRLSEDLPISPKNVHIHAIWLVHPEEIDNFRKVIGGLRFKFQVLNSIHADKVEWEPYLVKKARAGKLGSYVTKSFIKSEKKPLGGELFRIYPNSNYGGIPYRAFHTYRRTDRMLAKIRAAARAKR